MNWYRAHHGTPTNPKWLTVARRSGASPPEVVAVWFALLDHASQQEPRGSILGFCSESLGDFLGMPKERIDAVVLACAAVGMIAERMIAGWDASQYHDSSADRTRKWRSRQKPGIRLVTD